MADNSSNVRASNIKGLVKNNKTRNPVLIVGGVVLVLVVIGAMNLMTPSKKAQQGTATASVAPAPNVRSVAGSSNNPNYNKLVEDNNREKFAESAAKNTSTLPTLIGTPNQGAGDPFATTPKPTPVQTTTPPPAPPVTPQPELAMPRATQVNGSNNLATEAQVKAYANAQEQFDLYAKAWAFKPAGNEFTYYGQRPEKNGEQGGTPSAGAQGAGAGGAVGASGNSTASAATAGASKGPSFARAGTVVPAVLITPINSDTPGPILAEITSGPLSGARLIGTFSASENQVVVQFNTLSMVGQPKSFSIQAYAVDQTTASPGLATDVNHHYMKKYGLLAAAAFVSGYGQAIANQNTTTVLSPLGGATVTQGELSNSQISKAALGQVGQRIGTQVQQDSSQTRPTIKVEGAHGQGGVPIGILFLSDF